MIATLLAVTLTAYCPCAVCCLEWADGRTYAGTAPVQGFTVASRGFPVGTILAVEFDGHWKEVMVHDTGGPKDGGLDIYFDSHADALGFGRKVARVRVLHVPLGRHICYPLRDHATH